jgi:16S rRNA (cytosine1402-N4)-methyltransferase
MIKPLMESTPPPGSDQTSPTAPHKRRVRYSGTHPRRFAEKYKEHQPDRYADDVQKILASGKTPAGSHRPICVTEILEVLAPKPGELAVDATLGHGGHAREILQAILPGGRLFGMDVDPIELPRTEARLRAQDIPAEALVVRRSNFAGLPKFLAEEGIEGVDLILADLGVSSMQLDNPERGFSFKLDGPLDLRMNPQRGVTASAMLQAITEEKLCELLEENADEPHAREIAASICAARGENKFATTKSLSRHIHETLLARKIGKDQAEASVRRVFQALRIAVNDEFGALETFLRNLPVCLKPGGRVAILTFHSGEDRRVKKSFQAGERDGAYRAVSQEIIRPNANEIHANPRASSAKLRWAVKA